MNSDVKFVWFSLCIVILKFTNFHEQINLQLYTIKCYLLIELNDP